MWKGTAAAALRAGYACARYFDGRSSQRTWRWHLEPFNHCDDLEERQRLADVAAAACYHYFRDNHAVDADSEFQTEEQSQELTPSKQDDEQA